MFEKLYRVAVVLLLAAIVSLQILDRLPPPPPSEECTAALEEAAGVVKVGDKFLTGAPGDYDTAVYDLADNINQQIFMASDQTFALLYVEAVMEQAALAVQVACR